MLECHACLRSCMRALLTTPRLVNASAAQQQSAGAHLLRRSYQTETTASISPDDGAGAASGSNGERLSAQGRQARRVPITRTSADAIPADADREPTWGETVGQPMKKSFQSLDQSRRVVRGNTKEKAPPDEKFLRTELKYLKDPVKLADHVRYVLQSDDEDKALALCRMSSKAFANTVSWNHLVDWQMRKGKTNAALSTYNEMKKRGQKPDSYTYVLLLRGLANYAHHPNALGKALSLYHSMKAPNAQFPPNIIHINAVLKVCARANDMESLWDIASRLPEKGPHSADSWTFTTILNYMRINILNEIQMDPGSELSLRRVEEVIVKGKQLWSVILARWREGELAIDEEVVCAMGRLLLMGSRPRDWDNVLSLVEQTMNITRLEARLGTVARNNSGAPKIRAPYTPSDLKDRDDEIKLTPEEASEDSIFDPLDEKPPSNVQQKSAPSSARRGRGLFAFAKPGNSTLSLVLESCLKTILKHAAKSYWELFTDSNGLAIKPDLDNVHMLLRNLRRAGESTEAMYLVEDLPRLNLPPSGTTFWLAMAACQRDVNPSIAMENGRRLLDCMQRTLAVPNILVIHIYLELARQTKDANAMIAALQRIWPSVVNLRSLLSYGATGEIGTTWQATEKYRVSAIRLLKSMVQCYYYLLAEHRHTALGSLRITYIARRNSLTAFLKRQMEMVQPRLRVGGDNEPPGRHRQLRARDPDGGQEEPVPQPQPTEP